MKKSESGYAMCVAVFEQLIEMIILFGQRYNPSRPELQLSGLTALFTAVKNSVNAVNDTGAVLSRTIKARLSGFAELPSLVSNCRYIAEASGIPPDRVDGLKSLNRKIKGQRASKKLSPEEVAQLAAEGTEVHQKSASQTSFASRTNNFLKLIDILAQYPEYNPAEAKFSIVGLRKYHDELAALNTAVMSAQAKYNAERIERDKLLYDAKGLCKVGLAAKAYIKAVFGIRSREYAKVAGLYFRKPVA